MAANAIAAQVSADAGALRRELASVLTPGPRARVCAMTTIAVVGATTTALALDLRFPWWAAISGFMATQASGPGSIRKGSLRIAGTLAGAVFGLIMTQLLNTQPFGGLIALFAVSLLASLGSLVSSHAYAWLFFGVTTNLVALSSLEQPATAWEDAIYRVIEVVTGTTIAMIVATVLGQEEGARADASPPGWTDLLGSEWPAVQHALRAAITITLLPIVWNFFDLPSLAQTAITAAAVMAVPAFTGKFEEDNAVVLRRALHRLAGCLLGGLAALILLATPLTLFLPWLALLGAGVWICAHVQAGKEGVGYIGVQAAVVYIVTLVQGRQPPESLQPGWDRMVGITGGLLLLLLVTIALLPSPSRRPDPAPPGLWKQVPRR